MSNTIFTINPEWEDEDGNAGEAQGYGRALGRVCRRIEGKKTVVAHVYEGAYVQLVEE